MYMLKESIVASKKYFKQRNPGQTFHSNTEFSSSVDINSCTLPKKLI